MDTTQFRKAYTDYRKVEASVLSAQSDQWNLHAQRFANSIDLATIKRPVFRIPYALPQPVNTMETKKLYPKGVSALMPLSSTFTVNPTAGTERLFLDQWHQGLGLPTVQDDKAIENFKITSKHQFVENFKSVMENTRAPDPYKNEEATRIINLCRNFLAAIPTSKSKGPLLNISKEVYDKLVLVNAQLTREALTAIFDIISRITNKRDDGKLDERIKKEYSTGVAERKTDILTQQNEQIAARGGVKVPKSSTESNPVENNPAIGIIPNQGDPINQNISSTPPNADTFDKAPIGPGVKVDGSPGLPPPPPDANPVIDPNNIPAEPPEPAKPLVPITNEETLQAVKMVNKEAVDVITLNDLNAMKANFTRATDLIENAYTAANDGSNIRNVSATYAITDSAMPRGQPNQSQQAYVQQLKTITDKIQKEQEMNMMIQKYMSEGLTDVQARAKVNEDVKRSRETKPTVDQAASAILHNTENQAREVNANNTVINAMNTTSPLPITQIPVTPANPITNTNTQQNETAVPPTETEGPPVEPPGNIVVDEVETGEEVKTGEETKTGTDLPPLPDSPLAIPLIAQPFPSQIAPIYKFYLYKAKDKNLSAKEFAQGLYKDLGATADQVKDAADDVRINDPSIHSIAYVKPLKLKSLIEMLANKKFFELDIPDTTDPTGFNFIQDGINTSKFVKNVPELKDIREAVIRVIGLGKPKRARSQSHDGKKVTYAPGYKSKKQRKNERVAKIAKIGKGMEEEMRKAYKENVQAGY
jgi:hypothetical protein